MPQSQTFPHRSAPYRRLFPLLAVSVLLLAGGAHAAQVYVDTNSAYNYNPGDYYVQWYHGCGPTAAGSILNYWENNGYAGFINGTVDATVASNGHILDYYESPIVGDRGNTNYGATVNPGAGGGHADDSLADFMGSSDAAHPAGALVNGSTFVSFVPGAIAGGKEVASGIDDYADWRGIGVAVDTIEAPVVGGDGTLGWTNFTAEIDNGRPVIFWVDTNTDGAGDHFVPVFGYDDTPGAYQYYTYSEWGAVAPGVEGGWQTFRQLSGSANWGIGAMTSIRMDADPINGWGAGGAGWGAGGDGFVGGGPGGGTPEPETWALLALVAVALGWAGHVRIRRAA